MGLNISILGAGWLGLPLGVSLCSDGYTVKGAVTSVAKLQLLRDNGLIPYQILFDPALSGDASFFKECDILILNIPPRRRADIVTYHEKQIRAVLDEVVKANIKKVIFISSTSVYPELNRIVTEDDVAKPTKVSGEALVLAEGLVRSNNAFESIILRFAGLVGEDRKPGRFFAGKRAVPNGKAPINMIHQKDCIHIIKALLERDVWGETYNAVAGKHPTKAEFYTEAARRINLELPEFDDGLGDYKVISNQKLISALDYTFEFDDPMDMLE